MKKEKIVSANNIDDVLWRFYKISLNYKSGTVRQVMIANTVNSTINWYVSTGRACNDFLKALVNLSDYRINTIYKNCVRADLVTEAQIVLNIKRYLKVN